jgi:hypothetical protein
MTNAHSVYGNSVSLLIIVLNIKYIVHAPIGICLFCLLRVCLRRSDEEIACSPLIPGAFAKRPVNYIYRTSLQNTSDQAALMIIVVG